MSIHAFVDFEYYPAGDTELIRRLAMVDDVDARAGPLGETLLHVAARRRRASAVKILLESGADINARTRGGKTAYAHAARRGFDDIVGVLSAYGADPTLCDADRFAVLVVQGKLDDARVLADQKDVVCTGNVEEDRLLADVAGRPEFDAVAALIEWGADLTAVGLDGGTALHQACWFGQPRNARLLVDAGAPLEHFCSFHHSSPLGWAVHGSRYSGGAEENQSAYLELVEILLAAGAKLHYPDSPNDDRYRERLLGDASPRVRGLIEACGRMGRN